MVKSLVIVPVSVPEPDITVPVVVPVPSVVGISVSSIISTVQDCSEMVKTVANANSLKMFFFILIDNFLFFTYLLKFNSET